MRWLNRLVNTLLTAVVVAVPPALAGLWVAHRRPSWPTRAQIDAWMHQPVTAATIIAGLATVAAVCWLLLLTYLTRRALHTIPARWRRLRRMPLPGPAQMTAGSMAGVAALALPTLTVAPAAPAPSISGSALPPQPGTENPPAPATDDEPPSPESHREAGIDLPGGGWIPYRTAAAVTAVASLTWLHRRYHYRPHPGDDPHQRDADLEPLPTTVQAITTAGDGQPAPTGPSSDRGPLDALPDGILTLHGPGATAAARGLLVTALLDAALDANRSQVTLRRQDLQRILPGNDLDRNTLVGLRLDDNADSYLQTLTAAGRSAHLHHQILVLTRPAPQQVGSPHPLRPPQPSAVTVVVVTDTPTAERSWHVDADGSTSGDPTSGPRMCVLDLRTANDLIRLLHANCRRAGDHNGLSSSHRAAATSAPTEPSIAPPQPSTTTPAHLTLLGDCQLRVHGQPVRLRRSAALQIIAFLAIHPEGATTTELTRAVWPGLAPATITSRLHTTLADLRRQIHDLLGQHLINRRGDRYHLNTDAIDSDLQHLRHTVLTASRALTDDQRDTAYRDVIAAYHGELAAGHTWAWLDPDREAVRRDVIDAYLHLAETAALQQAARLLQMATAVDPYNQQLHRQAIHILRTLGEHTTAAALEHTYTHRLTAAGLVSTDTGDAP